ncbi:RNA recognition motif-containing protein [Gaertneriomyces sp. JEL0708]|nr:RNA recognition motif-containing protein [Gaertneriomyces sp. JEL0708]
MAEDLETQPVGSTNAAVAEKETEKTPSASTIPADRSRNTLFVSTIPYHATSEHLQEFFSDVGPVRSCFVVADNSAQEDGAFRNKGYGYVAYALPEDAETALKELKKKKFLGTRTLRIEYALKKKVSEERKAAGIPGDAEHEVPKPVSRLMPKPVSATSVSSPQLRKPAQSRTIIAISGLAQDLSKKQLYKKVRKYGDVADLVFPMSIKGAEVPGLAHVTYYNERDASFAIKHLHEHQFKGVKIEAKEVTEEVKEARKARLIIRNMAWHCTQNDLKKAFGAYGNVVEAVIPLKDDGKPRGFGFVQLSTLPEAQAAIEAMNGQKIKGRPVAVDWALAKAQYERAIIEEKDEGGEEDTAEEGASESNTQGGGATGGDSENNVEIKSDHSQSEDEHDNEEGSTESDGSDSEPDSDDVDVTFDSEEDGDDSDADDGELDSVSPSETKPRLQAAQRNKDVSNVPEGCTLFIRNLSFETNEDGLTERFSTFGTLRYARVTVDRESGRPRGTGFVCFQNPEDAHYCLAEYEKALHASAAVTQEVDTSKDKKKQKKLQPAKSILVPEPSLTSGASPFILDGRLLNITLAVDRQQANKLAEDGKFRRRAEDTRNMYLMREGVIFPESEAAKDLTPSEISKRQTSFAERKRLLATNPNLYISRTRLSVRNLGLRVDDKELKKVSLLAVKKFWDEVSKGQREPLEPEVIKEETEEGKPVPSAKRKANVKQAKIVRSKDRIDMITKLPRSKGYGFIEFDSHADALACLRWMNNNPRAFAPKPSVEQKEDAEDSTEAPTVGKRPIVEFSIENRQVVKRREDRRSQQQQKDGKRKRGSEDEVTDLAPKKKRFGEIWKERREIRKQKKQPVGASGEQKAAQKGQSNEEKQVNSSHQSKRKRDGGENSEAASKKNKKVRAKPEVVKESGAKGRPNAKTNQPVGTRVTAQPKKEKAKRPVKITKAQKEEKDFDSLVHKYKKDLFGAAAREDGKQNIKRWFG